MSYTSSTLETYLTFTLYLQVAFTGSTLVGRKIMEAAARTNLKNVTLELGGMSPNTIFNDAKLEEPVNWASHGILYVTSTVFCFDFDYPNTIFSSWNHGQACCAGSRIFVQSGIYDEFLKLFTEKAKSLKVGSPFDKDSYQGPQVSQIQYDVCFYYLNNPIFVSHSFYS